MKKILKLCKSLMLALVLPLVLVVLLILGYYALNAVERGPLVIFAGGGSVKNFIEVEKKVNINKETFPNSVYINLPSGYVPTFLKEEIIRFQNEEYNNHSFLYICLSAECLSAEEIDNIENKSNNARVFGGSIGIDPLVVYFYKSSHINKNNGPITIKELYTLIKQCEECKIKVYTTSKESGTYHAFENAFENAFKSKDKEDSITIIRNAELFFEDSNISEPSIFLSSKYYPPKKFDSLIYIKTESKPLYVYFVAYKKDGIFMPNPQILEFLNLIHHCAISTEKWEDWVQKQGSVKYKPVNINSLIESATN